MKAKQLLSHLQLVNNTRGVENIKWYLGTPLGGRIKKALLLSQEVAQQAVSMDKELGIVHNVLMKLYNFEGCTPIIRKALDKIEKLK